MTAARARRRPRGRRVLMWMAAFLVLGQLLSGLVFDYALPQIRFPEHYRQLANAVEQPAPPTVVCLGSSRLGSLVSDEEETAGLRRQVGDHGAWVANLSVPSGDPLTSEQMLRELLERGIRPRVALIEMCPLTVAQHNPWAGFFVERQSTWGQLPAHLADVAKEHLLMRMLQLRFVPLYAYRLQIRKQLAQAVATLVAPPAIGQRQAWSPGLGPTQDVPSGALNWEKIIPPAPAGADVVAAIELGIPYLRHCLDGYRPGGNLAAALERLVQMCQDNGIAPILVGVPVTSAYRQCQAGPIQATYQSFVADFCARHRCRFVDYHGALPDGMFLDYHHANAEGRAVFSIRVVTEILSPCWPVKS
jgi:hypothetical protein